MKKTMLCLANSYKLSGRCLAGYEINILPDNSFEPLKTNNKLKWLRPVSKESHGQIPTQFVNDISLFDIVDFNVIEVQPAGYQSENVLVDVTTIKRNRIQFATSDRKSVLSSLVTLDYMFDETFLSENKSVTYSPSIFGNRRADVNSEEIQKLNYSLMLIRAYSPKISFHGLKPTKPRLSFEFHGQGFDLAITDPEFILKYHDNKTILNNLDYVYITVSLGVEFNKKYYKLVAGVIL